MTTGPDRIGERSRTLGRRRRTTPSEPGSRTAKGDPRWARIAAELAALRERHRCAVRIVDADCACGALLIEAALYARTLGFTAIEGLGIDGSPAMVGRARAAAARLHDPAIGLQFGCVDMEQALAQEADFPADIVLCHAKRIGDDRPGIARALAAAAILVIGDPDAPPSNRQAA